MHSDITSKCVHTVVILVRVHSGNTSACTQCGITSTCVHIVVILVRVYTVVMWDLCGKSRDVPSSPRT